jgi:phosphinothricin acetyltransferase
MEAHIREAHFGDLESILQIINHAIVYTTAVYDYQPRTLEQQQQWFEKKQADNMPVIVAEYAGEVIGFGSYGIFRPWDAYRFSVEHSVYVDEQHRGKGIGRQLLRKLIELAKAQRFHTLIAGIDAANTNSYAFHQKFGFVEVGRFREVGYKFDKWLDLVFMQLFLE